MLQIEQGRRCSGCRVAVTLLLFALLLVALLLFSNRSLWADDLAVNAFVPSQTVAVQPVHYQDSYQYQRYFLGSVEALQSAQLGFEITGTIQDIRVDEGDSVRKGEVLATLDTARLNAAKQQAQANLSVATANAKFAAVTYQRVFDARRAQAVTEQQKDEAREGRDVSAALKQLAKAELASIEIELAKSKLLAPFDGVVIERLVDVGTVVNSGQPIVELQQQGQLKVRVAVTPAVADSLKVGEQQQVMVNDRMYLALVDAILPIRAKSRAVVVILQLAEPAASIRVGDTARLVVEQTETERGFWLPITALHEGAQGLWSVYVLVQQDGVDRAERRAIMVLHLESNRAYVMGAVNDNETVIIDGAAKLVPSQRVQVVEVNGDEN